jgi:hypothetical protein
LEANYERSLHFDEDDTDRYGLSDGVDVDHLRELCPCIFTES